MKKLLGIEIGNLEGFGGDVREEYSVGDLPFGEPDSKGNAKATGAGANVGDDRMSEIVVIDKL